jgi:hypothetical protein
LKAGTPAAGVEPGRLGLVEESLDHSDEPLGRLELGQMLDPFEDFEAAAANGLVSAFGVRAGMIGSRAPTPLTPRYRSGAKSRLRQRHSSSDPHTMTRKQASPSEPLTRVLPLWRRAAARVEITRGMGSAQAASMTPRQIVR